MLEGVCFRPIVPSSGWITKAVAERRLLRVVAGRSMRSVRFVVANHGVAMVFATSDAVLDRERCQLLRQRDLSLALRELGGIWWRREHAFHDVFPLAPVRPLLAIVLLQVPLVKVLAV